MKRMIEESMQPKLVKMIFLVRDRLRVCFLMQSALNFIRWLEIIDLRQGNLGGLLRLISYSSSQEDLVSKLVWEVKTGNVLKELHEN